MTPSPAYTERLGVPLRWWVQGIMFLATLWLALVVSTPGLVAWLVTGFALALMGLWFLSWGSVRLSVDDESFRAGRAHISAAHLGAATPLDAEAARRVAGVDADARAYLLLRPYLKRAVRVEITDPGDPTPYWLVNTRHPDELARALTALTHAG